MQPEIRLHVVGSRLRDHLAVVVGMEVVDHDAVEAGDRTDLSRGRVPQLGDAGHVHEATHRGARAADHLGRRPLVRLELDDEPLVSTVGDQVEASSVEGDAHRIAGGRRGIQHLGDLGQGGGVEHLAEPASEEGHRVGAEDRGRVVAHVRDALRGGVGDDHRPVRLHGAGKRMGSRTHSARRCSSPGGRRTSKAVPEVEGRPWCRTSAEMCCGYRRLARDGGPCRPLDRSPHPSHAIPGSGSPGSTGPGWRRGCSSSRRLGG